MPTKLAEQKRELARELFVQGFTPTQISRKIEVNADTVSTWSKRGQWTALRSKTAQEVARPLHMGIAQQSAMVRRGLASDLCESVEALRSTDIKRELSDLKRRLEVLEPIAKAAKLVFGWDSESKPGAVVIIGDMRDTQPQALQMLPDTTDEPQEAPHPSPVEDHSAV